MDIYLGLTIKNYMISLFIDTSLSDVSIALVKDNKIIAKLRSFFELQMWGVGLGGCLRLIASGFAGANPTR